LRFEWQTTQNEDRIKVSYKTSYGNNKGRCCSYRSGENVNKKHPRTKFKETSKTMNESNKNNLNRLETKSEKLEKYEYRKNQRHH